MIIIYHINKNIHIYKDFRKRKQEQDKHGIYYSGGEKLENEEKDRVVRVSYCQGPRICLGR